MLKERTTTSRAANKLRLSRWVHKWTSGCQIEENHSTLREEREKSFPLQRPRTPRRAGFTLIEVLISLAIIALVVSLGLPAISRITYQQLNSTTRRFVGLIRTVRNDAILLNSIYRLVFDLDKMEYWVENQREFKLLGSEDDAWKKKNAKKGEEEPSNFVMAQKYSKKPLPLPGGVVFGGVLTEKRGLISKGLVYIHFFPSGFNEQAIIYLNRKGATNQGYSLLVRSTMGQVEMFSAYIKSFAAAQ